MKLEPVKTIISILLAVIITYGLSLLFNGSYFNVYITGTVIMLSLPSILSLGVVFKDERKSINIKTVSGGFLIFVLGFSSLIALFNFSIDFYLIVSGISLLVFLLITYSIYKA